MELDNMYGLKEAHNISSFDTFFQQTGLYPDLTDPDAAVADKAISDLTSHWMDDGHSGFNSTSWMAVTMPEPIPGTSGQAFRIRYATAMLLFSDLLPGAWGTVWKEPMAHILSTFLLVASLMLLARIPGDEHAG